MSGRALAVLLGLAPALALACEPLVAAPRPSPREVRDAVEEVLSDPAYGGAAAPVKVGPGLVRRLIDLLEGVFRWIIDLRERTARLRETNPPVYWLVLLALACVLGLLLWHIASSIRRAFERPAAIAEEKAAAREREARFRELWVEAEGLAARGDLAAAVRRLLFALLARAEERHVPVLASWTNRELARRLLGVDALRGSLEELAATVDRLWYGREPAGREDYERSARIVAECAAALERAETRRG
ncbi:MAG: DUF4129 domain-containing protein [Planctomycetes bacterium]|nr:DUF4129 domain-containing protein [Planctomycetota bacterium]